jgi:hypothetical protein
VLSIIFQFEEVGDVRSWDLVRSKVEGRKWSRENRVYLLKAQEISAQRIFEEATQKVAKK